MISLMISRRGWWGREAGGKIQKILLQQRGRVGGHQQPTDDDDFINDFIDEFPPGLVGEGDRGKIPKNTITTTRPGGRAPTTY